MLLSIVGFTALYTVYNNQDTVVALFNDFVGRASVLYHHCRAQYKFTESWYETLVFAFTGKSAEDGCRTVTHQFDILGMSVLEKRYLKKGVVHVFKFAYPYSSTLGGDSVDSQSEFSSAVLDSEQGVLERLIEASRGILSVEYGEYDLTNDFREFAGQLVKGEVAKQMTNGKYSMTFQHLDQIKMYMSLDPAAQVELVTKDLDTVIL
mgnify:CR=1 FL=1